ncbi:hypothetical protein ACHHYP_09683 [Achlya hypogyna]|uniref:Uncharacterized protein n=1 Tax=Achlya hypogyna TaxID=1202772 RepID=A0A1V9YMN5_ACHHY|nr:hypothetical protein ACHHYP_09683 [Achlya hypogyna]
MATTTAETTADFNDMTEVIDSLESPDRATHKDGYDDQEHEDGAQDANSDLVHDEGDTNDHDHLEESYESHNLEVEDDAEHIADASVDEHDDHAVENHEDHPDDNGENFVEDHVEECEAEPLHEEVVDEPVHLEEEPVKAHVEETPVQPPSPPAVVVKTVLAKTATKTSPSRLRKPAPKSAVEKPATKTPLRTPTKEKAEPKTAPKTPPKAAVQPRLSLQARQSIGSKTTEETKTRPMLLRLPHAAYDQLFAHCTLGSLKHLAGVNLELYNAVHSDHRYWVKEPEALPPFVSALLAAADAKTGAKWAEAKAALTTVDVAHTVKLDDLRVLRNYRVAPPGVLLLCKTIVQLMRFAPPRAGLDERAVAGDWGVIKSTFLDLKLLPRALRIAVDRVLHRHPLPFTSQQLADIAAAVASPELDEAKLKRTCSALVPTLDVVRRVTAGLNVLARELELTAFTKAQLQHPTTEETAAAAVDAIVAKLDAPQPAPERSPSGSPTAADTKLKIKAKTVSRLVVAPKAKPTVDTTAKPAASKPATPRTAAARVPLKRPTTTPSGIAAPKAGRSSDDASSTSSSNGVAASKRPSDVKPVVKSAPRVSLPKAAAKEKPTAMRAKTAPVPATTLRRSSSTSSESMATLRADLVASSEELLRSTEDLKEKLALVAELEASLAGVQAALAEREGDVSALSAELEQKTKDLEGRQATVLEMQCIQETLSFRVTEMTQRDAEQATTIAQLQTEKTYLEAQLRDALARCEAAEADVEEKHALVEEKEEEHQKWEQAVRDQLAHEAQMDKYDLQKEVAELQAQLATLRSEHLLELASKQARIEQVEAEKKTYADELESAERRANLIHEERLQLSTSLQAAQAEGRHLTESVAALTDELAKEKKRVAAAEAAYRESLKMTAEDVATLD